MKKVNKAARLQSELLDKGFNFIEICDETDDGAVSILHCVLIREVGETHSSAVCPVSIIYDLSSDNALEILEKWLEQITIYPDPRTI